MANPSLIERIIGEMSKLRSYTNTGFQISGLSARMTGILGPTFVLDSSRVDYGLARELYRNSREDYKLGAAFAKPIVNTTAGFIGVPGFRHDDKAAQTILDDAIDRWSGRLIRLIRNAIRDGDIYVRINRIQSEYLPDQQDFVMSLIPPEWVVVSQNPIGEGFMMITIRWPFRIPNETGRLMDYQIIETITKDQRIVEVPEWAPPELQELAVQEPNRWGFIPVVKFRNEPEEYAINGMSDLEPVEPFLKVYHDLMVYSAQGAKLISRPKVAFKLANIQKFKELNFPAAGAHGPIRFYDSEVFLLQQNDDVKILSADTGLVGVQSLLKMLFYCIVDASETPEFAFGTAVNSSKGGVQEQLIPFGKKIRRKRGMFEEPFRRLMGYYLSMVGKVENQKFKYYEPEVDWEEMGPKDTYAMANTLNLLVTAFQAGTTGGLISHQAAVEFLADFVPTMLPYLSPDASDDELTRIAKTINLLRQLEDGSVDPADAQNLGNKVDQQGGDPLAKQMLEFMRVPANGNIRQKNQPPAPRPGVGGAGDAGSK